MFLFLNLNIHVFQENRPGNAYQSKVKTILLFIKVLIFGWPQKFSNLIPYMDIQRMSMDLVLLLCSSKQDAYLQENRVMKTTQVHK